MGRLGALGWPGIVLVLVGCSEVPAKSSKQQGCDDTTKSCRDETDDCKNESASKHEACPPELQFLDITEVVARRNPDGTVTVVTQTRKSVPTTHPSTISVDTELHATDGSLRRIPGRITSQGPEIVGGPSEVGDDFTVLAGGAISCSFSPANVAKLTGKLSHASVFALGEDSNGGYWNDKLDVIQVYEIGP